MIKGSPFHKTGISSFVFLQRPRNDDTEINRSPPYQCTHARGSRKRYCKYETLYMLLPTLPIFAEVYISVHNIIIFQNFHSHKAHTCRQKIWTYTLAPTHHAKYTAVLLLTCRITSSLRCYHLESIVNTNDTVNFVITVSRRSELHTHWRGWSNFPTLEQEQLYCSSSRPPRIYTTTRVPNNGDAKRKLLPPSGAQHRHLTQSSWWTLLHWCWRDMLFETIWPWREISQLSIFTT